MSGHELLGRANERDLAAGENGFAFSNGKKNRNVVR
jgi:hypothetical protein